MRKCQTRKIQCDVCSALDGGRLSLITWLQKLQYLITSDLDELVTHFKSHIILCLQSTREMAIYLQLSMLIGPSVNTITLKTRRLLPETILPLDICFSFKWTQRTIHWRKEVDLGLNFVYVYWIWKTIYVIIIIISNLSNDRSKASSKTIPPHSAI